MIPESAWAFGAGNNGLYDMQLIVECHNDLFYDGQIEVCRAVKKFCLWQIRRHGDS